MKTPARLLAALAAALAVAVPAYAASLAVGKKAEIKVDAKKMNEERASLWKQFGGWCSIKDWHPAIANCEESKEGDVQFRTLTLKDGGKIKEKLTEQKEFVYKYMIVESPLPVKNYEAQFALTPDDDDEDEINFAWSAVFDAEGKPDKEARATIDGIFKSGLENIKAIVAKGAAK
ncbi:MAG: SRPBCC family protein [Hyphomicrobium sp.]|nr:SRPBCC family protein [Hyphomicrobium sp.]